MAKTKIYSQNICWTGRKENWQIISKKISQIQPDVVCLQEVVFTRQANCFNLDTYYKSLVPLNSHVNCGGVMVLSKVIPKKVEFIKFTKQGAIFSFQLGERMIQKGFLVVEFDDFTVINTHFTADHKKNWREKNLKTTLEQTKELLDYVKTTIGDDKKLFILGDLNFTPQNKSYEEMEKLKLEDITDNIPFTYIDKKAKLDYIFTNFRPFYTFSEIVPFIKPPSDHFAMLTELEY